MRVDLSRMTAAALEAALNDGEPRRPRFSGMRAVAAGAALAVAARVAVKRAPSLPGLSELGGIPDRVRDSLADRGLLPDDQYEEEDFEGDEPEDEDFDDEPEAEGDEPEDEDFDDEPEAEGEDDDDEDEDDEGGEDDDDLDDGPDAEAAEDFDDEEEEDEDEDVDADQGPEDEADVDEEPEDDAEADVDDEPEDEEDEDDADDVPRRTAARSAPRLDVGTNGDGNGADDGADTPGLLELLSTRRSRPPVMSRRRRSRGRVDPAARPPEPPKRESEAQAGGGK
jgi:hypothetical protein